MSFQAQKTRHVNRLGPSALGALGLVLCCVLLSGCGKKPSQVDLPEGGREERALYPNLSTDSKPERAP